MAFWDRVRKLLKNEDEAAPKPSGPQTAVADAEASLEELELDPVDMVTEDATVDVLPIEDLELDETAAPEIVIEDDDPDSMDSIDRSQHLAIPEFIDEDEVTELGVDPDKVRSRMRLSDPVSDDQFPDDEVTEVTWLSDIGADAHTEEVEDDDTGEATLEVPEDESEETIVVAEVDEPAEPEEPEATQAVVYEEATRDEPSQEVEHESEVTDFHLDVFDWAEGEDTAPPSGLALKNSLQIADAVVAQALSVEHYPDVELETRVLHDLARSDLLLLQTSQAAGAALLDAIRDEQALFEAALLWTSFRTDHDVRAALASLEDGGGDTQLRQLAWAALHHLPWIVVAAEEGCPDGLRDASEALLDAYDARITLLETHDIEDQPIDSHPVTPVGLHALDGFAWSD